MDYVKDGYFSYTPKLGYPEFKDSISKALMEMKRGRDRSGVDPAD